MNKFYGVAGVNAYGVFSDYGKAMNAKTYIAKFKVKKFSDFEDAKEWAEDIYYDYQTNYKKEYTISEITRINWVYYRKVVEEK